MPIKWSAWEVSQAMDMVEEYIKEAELPLTQAKIVTTEARRIANLPEYIDQRLRHLIGDIERIDNVKTTIKGIRQAIPDGAIEAERESARHGSTQSLI